MKGNQGQNASTSFKIIRDQFTESRIVVNVLTFYITEDEWCSLAMKVMIP